jgi:hypothetical protein
MKLSRKLFIIGQIAFMLAIFSILLNIAFGDIFLLFFAGFFFIQLASFIFMREEMRLEKEEFLKSLRKKE